MSDHQDTASPIDAIGAAVADATSADPTTATIDEAIRNGVAAATAAHEDALDHGHDHGHDDLTHAPEDDSLGLNDHHHHDNGDDLAHDPAMHDDALSTSTTSVHAYASNGLQVLQAASDAAQALHNAQQHLAAHSQVGGDLNDAVAAQAVAAAAAAQGVSMSGVLGAHPFAPIASVTRDPTINPKLTRLRRACDMCSSRKVKCDESGPPCKPCSDLNVECTFKRELKRRGPPNKHAEAARAARRARLEPGPGPVPVPGPVPGPAPLSAIPPGASPLQGQPLSGQALPGQPFFGGASPSPHNAAQTLVSIAEGPATRLDAEAIAPMPVLELLVDDFFTYIHPLTPFPHEPTFRDAFATRQDRTNPEFLGLLASMIGALVASFPRSARQHLKAQHSTHLFPRAIVMIEKCRDIALDARGTRWSAKQPKTLDDAATSYFLGLASGYTFQNNTYRFFMSECLSMIRELGFHRPKHPGELPTFGNDNCSPDPLPFHHIKDQMGKRIFWCLLFGIRSFSQLGASQSDMVIPPSTPALPYPALPENVDDRWIMANEIQYSENNSVTLLTGFRFAAEIYTTMNAIVSVDLVYGMSTLNWTDQRGMLRDALIAAKDIVDRLPLELQLHGNHDAFNNFDAFEDPNLQYVPPAYPNAQPANDVRNVIKGNSQRRRQLQYEIQKANIFVSQLATRSYFVELYFNLRDMYLADPNKRIIDVSTEQGKAEKEEEDGEAERVFELMTAERELIVQNLLHVLGSISQRNLEPNGGSIINKVRQVASTLLHDAPARKGPLAVKSEEALSRLIDVLIKLERVGPGSNGEPSMTAQDEEEELNSWSHLRDYQQRFAAHGGYAGNL